MKIYRLTSINKIATMSLYVEGYEFDSSPLNTIYEISYKLNGLLFEKWMDKTDKAYFSEFRQAVPPYEIITIDGYEVDATTGTINFYLDGIQDARVNYFIDQIKAFFKQNKIGIGQIKRDQSRMYNVPVLRISVVSNTNSKSPDDPPELNISNNNAFYIFNTILRVDKGLWDDGIFDAADLKRRIEYFEGESSFPAGATYDKTNMEEVLGDVDFLNGTKGVSSYDDPRIREVLGKIKQICDWALNNGYKQVYMA